MISALLLLVVIVIAGCLDYKAAPATTDTKDDAGLVDEIAAIENELGVGEAKKMPTEQASEEAAAPVAEEVVLPDLEEKPQDTISEEDLETINVKENEQVKLNVKVTDPDKDAVTYGFSKPLDKRGEWKTNYGDAGEYIVTITATDGVHSVEKKVKINVQRVNVAPVIGVVSDVVVKEGEIVTFEPKVTDPNKDEITITISEPLKSGRFATDHTSAGQYKIKVTANDGEMESEKTFTLTVQNVNVPPEVKGLADLNVKEGQLVEIKPEVADIDGDQVKVTISDPVGDDGSWQTGYTDHGDYTITVTATDGKDPVVNKVKVHVEDVNMPPEIVSVSLARS